MGPLSKHEIYMKTCIDFIMSNNCPDALICSINCASDADVDRNTAKLIPFNNYGPTYLQLRICLFKIHSQRFERYGKFQSTIIQLCFLHMITTNYVYIFKTANIEQVACTSDSDFVTCSRLISPNTFVPVALPIDTTYVEVQSCTKVVALLLFSSFVLNFLLYIIHRVVISSTAFRSRHPLAFMEIKFCFLTPMIFPGRIPLYVHRMVSE